MHLRRLAVLAALALALGRGARAWAASSATLNIDVTIAGSLSVEVDGGSSSTQTVAWDAAAPNAKLVSPATATVRNDSGGRTEKWALATNPYSLSSVAGSTWALAGSTSSVGPDEFALQAVFGSSGTTSCPSAAAADWDAPFAPPLTAAPVAYTSTVFADTSLASGGTPLPDVAAGGADGRMHAGSRRALCWRLVTPSSTATAQTQNVQIIVTAVSP